MSASGPPVSLAQIAAFGGDIELRGWLNCHGQKVPIDKYPDLYRVIGTKYGGDGKTNFALPKLQDVVPGMRYVMACQGITATESMPPWYPDVIGFALQWHGDPPSGTRRANGELLEISEYVELYQVIDNKFGGSLETVGLPKLPDDWIFCVDGRFPI